MRFPLLRSAYFLAVSSMSSTSIASPSPARLKLTEYLQSRIQWGLSTWSSPTDMLTRAIAERVTSMLLVEAAEHFSDDDGEGKRRIVGRCTYLAKVLRASPGEMALLADPASLAARLRDIEQAYESALELRSSGRPSQRIHDRRDLPSVIYQWAERYLLSHFRRGGARKLYNKMHTLEEEGGEVFSKDLFANGGRIRVLDVGSLNNPLSECRSLEVLPIFNRTADACISTLDAQPIQERFDAALLVLTVAQYPTPEVTESVLSLDNALIVYVKIRLLVLRRLREALLPPGLGRQAHRSSLLVIIEREASFRGEDQERWRRALAKEGFLFVRQTPLQGLGEEHPGVMVPVGCLALVFALVGNPSLSSSSSASPGELLLAEDMLAPARTFASASDSDKRRVVIIGGGIGGTCLAGLLQRRGIEAAVFEKDAHQDVRKQGYAITVQQGLHALRALDIDISQVAVSSLSHSSFNADGRLLGAYGCGVRGDLKKQTGNHNFHIPRQRIRQLMADKLVPGTVCWGRRLVSIEEHEDCVDALFDDGSLERAGVLVAADGIHSIIRRDRAAGSLQYLGLLIILGISRHEGSVLEPRRQMQWLDGSARVFTMPFDREQTMWQMSFPLDEEAASRLSRDVCALKQEACARCTYWDPVLVRLLATTSLDCISGHPAYDRDPLRPEQWRAAETLASRVSLLGDAAHPMSPFKGQGANQALIDALTLADALVASELTFPTRRKVSVALAEYEREMCTRSAEKVLKSRVAAEALHGPEALKFGNITRVMAATAARDSSAPPPSNGNMGEFFDES